MDVRCFQAVTLGFRVGSAGVGDAWVHWSTGELRLDVVSRSMVFMPPGGQIHAKPLGCLLGAKAMFSQDGSARTFEVETNDSVHTLVQMSFNSFSDDASFEALARDAEVVCGKIRCGDPLSGVPEPFAFAQDDICESGLEAALRELHRGQAPLVYGGAEFYGPDLQGDAGSEVLLGRGAVVLLDFQESSRVGGYQLLFYSEDHCEPLQPLFRPWDIGPRTRVAKQGRTEDDYGPAVSFDFSPHGEAPLTLAFDDQADGEAFGRDMRVRIRLVSLSLRTFRGRQAVGDLRAELTEIGNQGWLRMLRRLVVRVVFLFLAMVLAQTVLLLSAEPSRPPFEVATSAFHESVSLGMGVVHSAGALGRAACEAVSDAVPVDDLGRCVSQPEGVRRCIADLLPSGSSTATGKSWWTTEFPSPSEQFPSFFEFQDRAWSQMGSR